MVDWKREGNEDLRGKAVAEKYALVTYRKKALVCKKMIGGDYIVVAECDNELMAKEIVKGLNNG